MHDRVGARPRERGLDFLSIAQIAFKKFSPRINGAAMAFAEIIKDADLMALIEKQLGANAADVTSAADNENFHSRESREARPLINSANGRLRGNLRRIGNLRGGGLLFLQPGDHPPDVAMLGARAEDFQALFV